VDTRPEPKPVEAQPVDKPVVAGDEVEWMWPASGKLITPFAEGSSKGIDIAGKGGDPVLAAAGGVVSYAGAGLRGYGNLVVLRHNGTYLSVYAHNSKILVKEKQTVTKGQKIAEIGSTDSDSPRLHFEIRRQGKPADPQKFLPAR
jgi:lipoprotein NlpD